MSAELLPCPFCGGAATTIFDLPACETCAFARRDAASWNRRAPVAAPIDAEGLPPMPAPYIPAYAGEPAMFLDEQMRQAQRDAKSLGYALGRGAAVREYVEGREAKQSVGDDPKFRALMAEHWKANGSVNAKRAFDATVAYIDGRTAGTASEAVAECTQSMLEAAMKAAVAAKMFPPSGSEDAYLRYWYGMKASVNAALAAAAPSPNSPQEGAK